MKIRITVLSNGIKTNDLKHIFDKDKDESFTNSVKLNLT